MSTFLITGGAGFIGSHLAHHLLNEGHSVLALDDLSTGKLTNTTLFAGESRYTFIQQSAIDTDAYADLVREADGIFHLAAAIGVNMIMQRPAHTIDTNVSITSRVLALACRERVPVVLTSTSEVYGRRTAVPYREDEDCVIGNPTCTRWGYSAGKLVDEFLALSYYTEHSLPVTIVRPFNVIGHRQTGRYGMVVPRFMQQALAGEPVTVYEDGLQTRCFCDVRDVTAAMLLLMQTPEAVGKVFNVGTDDEITIEALAQKVISLCGSSSEITYTPYKDVYGENFEDIRRRVPDNARVKAVTGWQPRFNLDMTLREMFDVAVAT